MSLDPSTMGFSGEVSSVPLLRGREILGCRRFFGLLTLLMRILAELVDRLVAAILVRLLLGFFLLIFEAHVIAAVAHDGPPLRMR